MSLTQCDHDHIEPTRCAGEVTARATCVGCDAVFVAVDALLSDEAVNAACVDYAGRDVYDTLDLATRKELAHDVQTAIRGAIRVASTGSES